MSLRLSFGFALVALLALAPSTARLRAQDAGTFTVTNGAAPWSDRAGTWQLAGVPASLEGNGPLPQQSCGARVINLTGSPTVVTVGVSQGDVDKFKTQNPTATATGDTISVAHPDGTGAIPYTVFRLPNPPATIGDGSYGAGLLLLQVNDKPGAAAPAASSTPAPAPPAQTPAPAPAP